MAGLGIELTYAGILSGFGERARPHAPSRISLDRTLAFSEAADNVIRSEVTRLVADDPMPIIYIDADACPVKDEVYRVARRYACPVKVVANAPQRIPTDPLIELVVCPGFGAADDWIAAQAKQGDVVVTADIPLAARCLANDAAVLGPKGYPFTEHDIGSVLATRDLMEELRQGGTVTGGPAPMTPKDRSRFLAMLDQMVNASRRAGQGGR
jgi:uncharacterized protein